MPNRVSSFKSEQELEDEDENEYEEDFPVVQGSIGARRWKSGAIWAAGPP
jgi:hypothetical protein